MGIEELIQHIEQTTQKQVEEILHKAHRVKEREISQAKKQLKQWLEEQRKALVKEKLLIISQTKSQVFKQVGLMRTMEEQKIWNEFKEHLILYLKKSPINENYINMLITRIEKTILKYKLKNIKLHLNERDQKYLETKLKDIEEKLNIKIEIGKSINCLGGIIIEDCDSKANFVFTVDEILESWEEFWKSHLIEKLNST